MSVVRIVAADHSPLEIHGKEVDRTPFSEVIVANGLVAGHLLDPDPADPSLGWVSV